MNQFEIISMVAQKALPRFINNLGFAMQVKNPYQSEFGRTGAKIGGNYQIRLPVNFVGASGPQLQPEDIIENVTPLSITAQLQVSFLAYGSEETLYMDDHMERYGYPAIETLADKFDRVGLALFNQVAQMQGVPGVSVQQVYANAGGGPAGQYAVQNLILNANAALTNQTAPVKDRVVVNNPIQDAGYVGAFTNIFQPSSIGDQWKGGRMKQALGVDFAIDQNMPVFTTGGSSTSVTVVGGGQSGNNLNVTGLTGTINPGDSFTLALVGDLNPKNYQPIAGQLKQFTVTSSVTGTGGAVVLPLDTPINAVVGVGQTVTASPANGAPVVFNNGAAVGVVSPQAFLFHPDALTWACPALPQYDSGVIACRTITDKQTGISIRVLKTLDARMDQEIYRCDLLVGWAVQRKNWIYRIAN